jgi:heme oxygenase
MTKLDTALGQIRAHTRDLHEELEELVAGLDLFSSREGLIQHIEVLLSHHERAAKRALGTPDIHAWIKERVDDLAHDVELLRAEGVVTPNSSREFDSTSAEPRTFAANGELGRGAALGEAYVVEGSRLGAEAIAKTLRANGMWHDKLRFASDAGTGVGARWRRFQSLLSALDASEWNNASEAAAGSFRELLGRYDSVARRTAGQRGVDSRGIVSGR